MQPHQSWTSIGASMIRAIYLQFRQVVVSFGSAGMTDHIQLVRKHVRATFDSDAPGRPSSSRPYHILLKAGPSPAGVSRSDLLYLTSHQARQQRRDATSCSSYVSASAMAPSKRGSTSCGPSPCSLGPPVHNGNDNGGVTFPCRAERCRVYNRARPGLLHDYA